MKRLLRCLFLLCFAITCNGQAQTTTSQSEYAALVARVKSGDVYINFKRLRILYLTSPERQSAKNTIDEQLAASAALLRGEYQKAIDNADTVLANEFVNIGAHFVEYHAHEFLKDAEKARFHKAVLDGLMSSIVEKTSGESKKDAWVVISAEEENMVLALLALQPVKHTAIQEKNHTYELVEAIDPESNKTVKRYFNVDLVPK